MIQKNSASPFKKEQERAAAAAAKYIDSRSTFSRLYQLAMASSSRHRLSSLVASEEEEDLYEQLAGWLAG